MSLVVFCGACGNVTDKETLRCLACGEQQDTQSERPYAANVRGVDRSGLQPGEVAMWAADLTVPRFAMDCGLCGRAGAEHLWIDPETVVCRACCGCVAPNGGGPECS